LISPRINTSKIPDHRVEAAGLLTPAAAGAPRGIPHSSDSINHDNTTAQLRSCARGSCEIEGKHQ
jgi:hypothetical protein